MKKIITITLLLFIGFQMSAQNYYWVFFTDKQNTHFDPYQYFDTKAIQRYQQNHLNLYDISNYPVNDDYKMQVNALTTEYIGESRWLNALAVTATENEIAQVQTLPFVAGIRLIEAKAILANAPQQVNVESLDPAMNQVALMQGEKFYQKGINGKGVRIAVLDGGFPEVNTHPAFAHLRDNHQIVKTWNFANKKENVYGYNAHGRMVLSCIAGIMNDTTMLGLAPGAEFLLARTEVEVEKMKEEVWWVQALEWADQNGADIISSSLGYGKDLHSTRDMDGKTSIVAKGARTAASKGILVCTAMGNEGSESDWKVLVTPADADSVLSVGAVRSLEQMEIYSSFGPTADGRRKPNVVACGYDMVAQSKGNYDYSQGTSFATPMVSGFAACVKQMHPDWTAMQLLQEIEKSANHYPYYDYAFGYGVPQASYFTETKQDSKKTFTLKENDDVILVIPNDKTDNHKLFYNIQNGDGSIENYFVNEYDQDATAFSINKSNLSNGQTVNIWYDGQYSTYIVGKDKLTIDTTIDACTSFDSEFSLFSGNSKPSANIFIRHRKIYSTRLVLNASFMVPSMWSETGNIHQTDRISRSFSFSILHNWQVARVYGLGFRWGFGSSWYALQNGEFPGQAVDFPEGEVKKHNLKTSQLDVEIYQRFILANLTGSKLFLETGFYGDWITGSHLKTKIKGIDETYNQIEKRYYREGINKLDCGVRVRLGFTKYCALYGQYRITPVLKNGVDLPKWEVGIQIF